MGGGYAHQCIAGSRFLQQRVVQKWKAKEKKEDKRKEEEIKYEVAKERKGETGGEGKVNHVVMEVRSTHQICCHFSSELDEHHDSE